MASGRLPITLSGRVKKMEFGLFEKGEKDIILFFNDGLPEGVQCLAQVVGVKELVQCR